MIRTTGLIAIALFAALAGAAPAAADTAFSFTFAAPNGSFGVAGDTATGSGTLTATDADADGHYTILAASGSYYRWVGDSAQTIAAVTGAHDADFTYADAYLFKDASGGFVTNAITFYTDAPYDGLSFAANGDGSYGGSISENQILGGTLGFTQTALVSAAPEPATWALLILGFGLAGVALRRARPARARLRAA